MTSTCVCGDKATWFKSFYRLIGEEVACLECGQVHGPKASAAVRERLQAGGRLLLVEDLNLLPDPGTIGGLTEEQVRQRRLLRLPGGAAKGGSEMDLQELKAKRPDLVQTLTDDIPISSVLGRGVVQWHLDEALHDQTFAEITRAVSQAVRAKFNATGNTDVYPMEYFLGRVIVQVNGKLFDVPYELDDETGEATLGKAKEVRVRFVPAEAATGPSAGDVKEALAAATAPLTEEMRRARRLAGLPG